MKLGIALIGVRLTGAAVALGLHAEPSQWADMLASEWIALAKAKRMTKRVQLGRTVRR